MSLVVAFRGRRSVASVIGGACGGVESVRSVRRRFVGEEGLVGFYVWYGCVGLLGAEVRGTGKVARATSIATRRVKEPVAVPAPPFQLLPPLRLPR